MNNDSPFWVIEGEVIPEIANFEEEGLVTPQEWGGEKENLKIWWFTYQNCWLYNNNIKQIFNYKC